MTPPFKAPARPQAGQPPSAPPGGGFTPTRGRELPFALVDNRGAQSHFAPLGTHSDCSPIARVSDRLFTAPVSLLADETAPTLGRASSLRTRRAARQQGTAA